MTAPAPTPESGTLSEHPLPRMLLELYGSRFTGHLELSRARTRKLFMLQDGALVGSESNVPSEHLTALLEDTGVLSRQDRDRVSHHVRSQGCKVGVALLSLEVLDAKQLFEGLREQVRRRAIECFGWPDGDFKLQPSRERKEDIQPFRTDPFRLVQEGLQSHWSLERMLETLAPQLTQYANAAAGLGKVVRRLSLDASVERMIAGLSGKQTLGSVIGAALSSPAALAAFLVLDGAGALSYSDTPQQAEAEDAAPEIEIEIADDATPKKSAEAEAAKLSIAKATHIHVIRSYSRCSPITWCTWLRAAMRLAARNRHALAQMSFRICRYEPTRAVELARLMPKTINPLQDLNDALLLAKEKIETLFLLIPVFFLLGGAAGAITVFLVMR